MKSVESNTDSLFTTGPSEDLQLDWVLEQFEDSDDDLLDTTSSNNIINLPLLI
jgi:hypothetical protein